MQSPLKSEDSYQLSSKSDLSPSISEYFPQQSYCLKYGCLRASLSNVMRQVCAQLGGGVGGGGVS